MLDEQELHMASHINRYHERKEALSRIKKIREDSGNAFVIHYSCESFYSTPEGRTARVTSLAVRNLSSAQTKSFSIHKIAEQKEIAIADIPNHYDELEKEMLKEFFEFVKMNSGRTFVHWNMRDNNYGFAAIEHRFKVLGGEPVVIDEVQKFDLARALVSVYGIGYVGHGEAGRFLGICKLNKITDKDALTGKSEADAFENKEYIALHLSTLRKIDMMANVFERTEDNSLKTNSRLFEIYGRHPQILVEAIREHWVWSLIVIIAVLIGFLKFFV